jgi:hypothetical protein
LSKEYRNELLERVNRSIREEKVTKKPVHSVEETVGKFCGAWQSDKDADEIIAEIKSGRRNSQKARLTKTGNLIDDFDLLIGCSAVANNLIMVTDNVKHLSRIKNIVIENWVFR